MKSEYRIVGFKVLSATSLKPHHDVQLPMDEEDSCALDDSVREKGILDPLIISHQPDKLDGLYFIYDGVNRWKVSQKIDGQLPCILVECANPRELALTFLGVGRKRSTGQRIMADRPAHHGFPRNAPEGRPQGRGDRGRWHNRCLT